MPPTTVAAMSAPVKASVPDPEDPDEVPDDAPVDAVVGVVEAGTTTVKAWVTPPPLNVMVFGPLGMATAGPPLIEMWGSVTVIVNVTAPELSAVSVATTVPFTLTVTVAPGGNPPIFTVTVDPMGIVMVEPFTTTITPAGGG